MHKAQTRFCQQVKEQFPEHFLNRRVLDVGSYNVNGDNRYLFTGCQYLGIDIAPGPNVDRVVAGHELDLPDGSFDVVISTECLEHDMYYADTLRNAVRMLKGGGLLLFTCATTGRKVHGTVLKNPDDSPATVQKGGAWAEYYKNLTEEDVQAAIPAQQIFDTFSFTVNPVMYDLYFWGIKKQREPSPGRAAS